MKNLLLATVGVLALGVTSASAADIQRRAMPVKAPEVVMSAYSWAGPYIGIQGGGGWGRSDNSIGGSSNLNGGLIGGTLGYNWQSGPLVYGLETDLAFANISGSGSCGGGLFSCSTRNNWLGTARGRIGYAMDRWMPYVTGGFAYGGVRTSLAGFDNNRTKSGWTVGGGIEAAIAGPWTAKVEYLHVDLGSVDAPFGTSANYRSDIVRAGLNYRF
jgi:outer membrane immunogenic protein